VSTTSELDDVMALLERVLPDPVGYGRRLLQQFVLQWAETGDPQPAVVPGEAQSHGADGEADAEAGTEAGTEAGLVDRIVRGAGHEHAAEADDAPAPYATQVPGLLASALGACDCWGTRTACQICAGAGSPGWADPDPDLFQAYVAPAAARLSNLWEDHIDEEGLGDHAQRPRQGVNA
jgi:hypothetical protein